MFSHHHKTSFTLIEMLIVVVIIGILAGVLVPRIVSARERASDASRDVKVNQISQAIDMYKEDHGSYPLAPFAITGDGKTKVPSTIASIATSGFVGPYLSSIPTDTGKGVAVATIDGECLLGGESFAYYTDLKGSMYAITSLSESKKGNTTNCKGVVDANNDGGYKVRGSQVGVAGGGSVAIDTSKPGVYHNGGHIIVTDGTNVYTMMDKNLGATEAGTDHTNPAIRGAFFQWGNNHPFSSTVGETVTPNSTTPVNTSGMTTYTSSTWIYGPSWNLPRGDWSLNQNDDLRPAGGQGPCPSGYHLPTYDEWRGLVNTRASLTGKTTSKGDGWANFNADLFSTDLKLPKAGNRSYDSAGSVVSQGDLGYYWSSTRVGTYSYRLRHQSSHVNAFYYDGRAYGYSVRCFKNSGN